MTTEQKYLIPLSVDCAIKSTILRLNSIKSAATITLLTSHPGDEYFDSFAFCAKTI